MNTDTNHIHLLRYKDDLYRESIPIGVIPDIRYRESLLGSFRMDPRHKLRG